MNQEVWGWSVKVENLANIWVGYLVGAFAINSNGQQNLKQK